MGRADEGNGDLCVRCGAIGEDRRTLWMACFYEMNELAVPFSQVAIELSCGRGDQHFYTLRVCKACRASWMSAIEDWFGRSESRAPTGTGVYLRKNGETYEATPEEVAERFPNGGAVRVAALVKQPEVER